MRIPPLPQTPTGPTHTLPHSTPQRRCVIGELSHAQLQYLEALEPITPRPLAPPRRERREHDPTHTTRLGIGGTQTLLLHVDRAIIALAPTLASSHLLLLLLF
ncbi:hypothetical protein ASPCAL04559 [Aspergillus calidoustus]|uniref:Uncharacterized protein n=1 Tax=Aspergillus calidoustus TaxID=454130 RepID=A0A0U5C5J0_ASPCI|nr:hypothetical protein ASPCAL04559 [Aspergillus calidoustus]